LQIFERGAHAAVDSSGTGSLMTGSTRFTKERDAVIFSTTQDDRTRVD
jgi:hypothetical protein